MSLSGKTVLVTGASAGIGRATAVLLSGLGATVVISGRKRDALAGTLSAMSGSGHHLETFDLERTGELTDWMKSLVSRCGPLGGIAHCAGVQALRPLKLTNPALFDEMLRVNVTSSMMLARAYSGKGMNDSGGAVVFVSSVMGAVGSAGRSAYCASKSALHGLARALSLELARDGIRVNCVAPGFVRTASLEQTRDLVGEEGMMQIRDMHPLGFGEPDDVANAIAFLLAETGRWITGSVLFVDGGFTAH